MTFDLDDDLEGYEWGESDQGDCDNCHWYDWEKQECRRGGQCPYVGEF